VEGAGSFRASPSANPGGLRKRIEIFVRVPTLVALGLSLSALAGASTATAATDGSGQSAPSSGGARYGEQPSSTTPSETSPSQPTVPGSVGRIRGGLAYAPADAPVQVKKAIWAANAIRHRPYVYGGGHGSFRSRGYDCSGTLSYALHGGGLLRSPLDSGSFASWGQSGRGAWITVYTNPGHAYAIIAGLRLDTSGPGERGPRWRTQKRSASGFQARHPVGY